LAGFERAVSHFPVPSCVQPADWATGAPLELMRVMRGTDARDKKRCIDPHALPGLLLSFQ
jgi:hypothetical protein